MNDMTTDDISSSDVNPNDIIAWLNEHLALYAAEVIDLRKQIVEKDRKIERLLQFCRDFRRQKEEA